jgi:hypothetical protein
MKSTFPTISISKWHKRFGFAPNANTKTLTKSAIAEKREKNNLL